jgi:hypothetical protein
MLRCCDVIRGHMLQNKHLMKGAIMVNGIRYYQWFDSTVMITISLR